MEEKINVAELLKDCPKGMELDCILYDNIYFDTVGHNAIKCYIQNKGYRTSITFDFYGGLIDSIPTKCVIFPKGKTTWEGFQRLFKDGDILATDLGSVFYLNTRLNTDERYGCYVGVGGDSSFHICVPFAYKECCGFATEDEKEKLFKAIIDNGYNWNSNTKTLEKLIVPKFDISLLKPFDKVLVRDENLLEDSDITDATWSAALYSHNKFGDNACPYVTTNGHFAQCVPYEGNEHLLGTTDDCDEYYKTWE